MSILHCITLDISGNLEIPTRTCPGKEDIWSCLVLYPFIPRHIGPYCTPGARRSASVFASLSTTCCLNSKCICSHLCTHGHAGLKKRCVQAHCWRVAILRNWKSHCAIDQLKSGLKSKVNGAIFILLFKERVSRKCASGRIHNTRSLCLLHRGTHAQQHTNMPNIKN